METKQIFIIISAILAFVSPIVYAVSIYRGRTIPHRVTRFVIALAAVISFASILADEGSIAVWLAGVFALRGVFLFFVSLQKGVGGKSGLDIASIAMACVGLLAWKLTAQPFWALVFAIVADFIGFAPALIKTYKNPASEGPWFYFLETGAVLLTILAITSPSREMVFPTYILVCNIVMICFIFRKAIGGMVA